MARSINEIVDQMVAEKESDSELAALNSTSKTAIYRLLIYIVAVAIWTLENLFDFHQQEVEQVIADTRVAYLSWYDEKAKAFQFGFDLEPDEIYYDNTGLDDATIEASRVVKYAASTGILKGLRIKIAGETDGELAPLPLAQFDAFKAYMNRIKPAGIQIKFVNENADSLKLSLKIYYNALVLNSAGQRLDGSDDTPVLNAINEFLRQQTFGGLFVLMRMVDHLQEVEGVEIPHIVSAEAKYAAVPYMPVDVTYLPDSGYLRILNPVTDLTIQYIPHEPV